MAQELTGVDFNNGVPVTAFGDSSMLVGHADGEAVLLVREDSHYFAIGAHCSHYGAPLEQGLVVGGTVRCPWHHACFKLKTGEAIEAPARDGVGAWTVEERNGVLFTTGKQRLPKPKPLRNPPDSVVIIGGGAAGEAAAEMLRSEGYEGRVTLLSADADGPIDRPNLSKDYLSGAMEADWLPLRDKQFFIDHQIDLVLNGRVTSIDTADRRVELDSGITHRYDALLIATGAIPVRLPMPGGELIYYLRDLADCEALREVAVPGKRAVVIGSSFIGMEVAAALRKREVEVTIVSDEAVPMQKVLGAELGEFFRTLHENHGVAFHMNAKIESVTARAVVLEGGERIVADFVVAGVGVTPATDLAEAAGIAVDSGVTVDAYLQTDTKGVFAAGDIARWPDKLSGAPIRVEHWVVAQRQGQVAARNILGRQERFEQVPFFWTGQYDVKLRYVGQASSWDNIVIDGDLDAGACTVSYQQKGKTLAMATLKRDTAALEFVAAHQPASA